MGAVYQGRDHGVVRRAGVAACGARRIRHVLRFAYGAAYNAGCKRISYGGQVVRDAVVATVAWRVVIASVDTAYGARLVGYILVSARRVFFLHGDTWRCLIFLMKRRVA